VRPEPSRVLGFGTSLDVTPLPQGAIVISGNPGPIPVFLAAGFLPFLAPRSILGDSRLPAIPSQPEHDEWRPSSRPS
jgi:hypothetical protein